MSLRTLVLRSTDNPLGPHERSAWMERLVVLITLALYAVLMAYLVPRHEPWADEAQAWELAKSLSLGSLFGTYLHYECSPGLWHLLLWMLARIHVTYSGLHWFNSAVALASMALLMLAAPFPLIVRVVLPFTYFFGFQYAVVARSYVLFPALLFALACLWTQRREHPLAVSFLLGLLGNVSIHGLAVAIGMSVVLAIEWSSSRRLEGQRRRVWLLSAVLLTAMLVFSLWCLVPAPDAGWVVLAKRMPSSVSASGITNHPWMRILPAKTVAAVSLLLRFTYVLSYGFDGKFHLGFVVWLLFLWRLKHQRMLRYAWAAVVLAITCVYSPFNFYHAGLFWVLFVFLWWITWPQEVSGLVEMKWAEIALLVIVCACVASQLIWETRAIRYDVAMPYSSSRDAAAILKTYLNRGDTVDLAIPPKRQGAGHGPYYITGIEPYFIEEPIHNKVHRFWFWGGNDDVRAKYLADSEHHAVVVIVEEPNDDTGYHIEESRLESMGYQRAKSVCGKIYSPDGNAPVVCDAFYQPYKLQGQNP